MRIKKLLYIAPLIALILIVGYYALIFVGNYIFFRKASVPLYEVGDYKGAGFCAECHEEIYGQWLQNSSHAEANTNPRFVGFRDKINGNFVTSIVIGDANCYACMGPREVPEGVNCETCHGLVIPGKSISETHEQKFSPELESLKKPEFCAKCHQFPETGEGMSLYSEWKGSAAARQGMTCQDCHMERRGDLAYHGFDSLSRSRDAGKYSDDVNITDINLDFPLFRLVIENLLTSHALPPSGPSRLLVLHISFLDSNGAEIHQIVETFAKKFNLLPIVGIHPFTLKENTQLQSGEARALRYTLPSALDGRISKAVLTLRFYDVSDEYAGDLEKAHWISEPFIRKEYTRF